MLKYLVWVIAIVAFIDGRPQMWRNYGMREEIDVASNLQDENEMPIFINKRVNQRNPFEMVNNVKEDSSSEETEDENNKLNSVPKNVGVELIFGSSEKFVQSPFAIDDAEWDLSKYASLKDRTNNEESSEEKQSQDSMQQFYLPRGIVVENPQGEILEKKEQPVDNSNSDESSSNEQQQRNFNNDETPMKYYNPPGVIIDRIVYQPIDEILPNEQILEMSKQQAPEEVTDFEESNENSNNNYDNIYFPKGLVIDPYQTVDVSSEEEQQQQPVNVYVKEFVEVENRPMRDYDNEEVKSLIEVPDIEEPEVEVPEPEVPVFLF